MVISVDIDTKMNTSVLAFTSVIWINQICNYTYLYIPIDTFTQ